MKLRILQAYAAFTLIIASTGSTGALPIHRDVASSANGPWDNKNSASSLKIAPILPHPSNEVSVRELEEIEGRKFYDNVGARLADGLIRVIDAVQARIEKDKEVNAINFFLYR